MISNPLLGVLLHAIGGLMSAIFYLPYRKVKHWSWESYWIVGGVFSWIVVPWIVAFLAVPNLMTTLSYAPPKSLLWSYFFGVLWGIGGATFGLTVRYLGFALGTAMALGYCAAFGTLLPPIFDGKFIDIVTTPSGLIVMSGVALCLLGIVISGFAGVAKERELPEEEKKASVKEFSFKKGVWVATFCGIMSACMSYGFAAGKPIAELAVTNGASDLWKNLPVLIVILAGGFTTNLIWCAFLNIRNSTGSEYFNREAPITSSEHATPRIERVPLFANYALCAVAGTLWYLQFFFYGMGSTKMGRFDFSSWTLHMASIMIFGTLVGVYLSEWKGVSHWTHLLMRWGLAVLVASTVVIGYGNYLAKGETFSIDLPAGKVPAAVANEATFSTLPGESVLLLGEHTVASTSHLTQRFLPAGKHPANPVMSQTEAWEGVGPYVWGNRLMQDEQTGLFRLWYITYDYAGNFYRWGYATSPDGIAWTKPNLGVERYADAPATNLLPLGPHPEKGTRSIARDPRPETPAERRFLGVRFTYDGEFVSFSPDGIDWKEHPLSPSWHVPSDIIHVMWDNRRHQFVAYYKLWELAGTQVTDAGGEQPFLAYMPTFTNTKLPDDKESFEGPVIHFNPNAAAEVKTEKFVLRAENQGKDDGGGTSLSGSWTAKRVQAWASSNDGIHWENEQVILRADEQDPPSSNIQYMFVIQHGGYYLGFITMHDESGYFRQQLAWSADGINWHRLWREPWLDVGPEGAFDMGMVCGPADPIINEREMWFPYGGFPIRHDTKETNWKSAIGLATTRLDGFAAWEAGAEAGELITQPFRCNGDRLFVNADARGGSLTVEALDASGAPLKGFEAASCSAVTTDTLANGDQGWVRWTTDADLTGFKGMPIQLKFKLQNARLYSFRIADADTINLPAPRATTH